MTDALEPACIDVIQHQTQSDWEPPTDSDLAALEEILLVHLEWAAVGEDDLVADDHSAGPSAERVEFQHPDDRRYWLRKHYESLMPALYREATKHNTDLIYDILDVIRQRGRVTYETLVEETGAAYRTVREHVRVRTDQSALFDTVGPPG